MLFLTANTNCAVCPLNRYQHGSAQTASSCIFRTLPNRHSPRRTRKEQPIHNGRLSEPVRHLDTITSLIHCACLRPPRSSAILISVSPMPLYSTHLSLQPRPDLAPPALRLRSGHAHAHARPHCAHNHATSVSASELQNETHPWPEHGVTDAPAAPEPQDTLSNRLTSTSPDLIPTLVLVLFLFTLCSPAPCPEPLAPRRAALHRFR